MLSAANPSEFLANPVGRYCLGRRHLVFCHSPSLLGHVSWGRPDVEDVRAMLRLCEIGLRAEAPPHAWLVDLRGLEGVDAGTFGLMVDYVRSNGPTLRTKIMRQAQLRPDGFVGAIITGFSQVARLPYPERVFAEVDDALSWLGIDHDTGVGLLSDLERARDSSLERSNTVQRVREMFLSAGPIPLSIMARKLALSNRTLQRALGDAGTNYRAEVKAFQIRRAEELLRQEDRNLTWIAAELGFSSLQHFTTAFRRATTETPSAWRARARGADARH